MSRRDVPGREDWGNLLEEPEVAYAFRLYGGKPRDEAVPLFAENPIERAAELRFAPQAVFNYYVCCFADFLLSPAAREASDAASCFLRLVRDRMRSDPNGTAEVYPALKPAIDWVSAHQSFFDADVGIYGSFTALRREIERAYAAVSA